MVVQQGIVKDGEAAQLGKVEASKAAQQARQAVYLKAKYTTINQGG